MAGELRRAILSDIDDSEIEKIIKDHIDDIYEKFREIRDKLDSFDLNNLDRIYEAFDIADNMADGLY